ncbi:putative E3 ubiquitin-protein ligase TRIM68 [Cocos nucifera]|uniref:Putative E3 ubiquitin-protein ligase TRIM68 n=1 Tax=Cocos nucifera TaxID=13894 RepID=A0A8K0MY07_COCNU|nr:putative E3 ubiquitin-protein ligase TRIM68 [Cocos nucifera]
MACMAIQSWTFSSLVGAYLDLALAYIFLCASALAFLASKSLAFFGLALPCPCNGLFGQPRCLQGLLVDYPPNKIEAVHMSLRSRFPFDCPRCSHRYDVGSLTDGGAEEPCGSTSNDPLNSKKRASQEDVKGEECRFGERPPLVPRRRRRRRPPLSRAKSPPASPTPPPPLVGWQGEDTPRLSSGTDGQVQRGVSEESGDGLYLFGECIGLDKGAGSATECNFMEKDASAGAKEVSGSEGNVTTVIRNLQRVLKKEQSAHAALSLELKKERNAAATAADEAMAMILRLQKEKAEIEMEARQYRSIVEEKYAYNEEEMEILKEIIVRRERENHVLEKEVNAYRQMILNGGDQQADIDLHDVMQMMADKPGSSCDALDGSMLMLQEIYECVGKKEEVNSMFDQVDDTGPLAGDIQSWTVECMSENNVGRSIHGYVEQDDSTKRLHHEEILASRDEQNIKFQEKGMVAMQEVTSHLTDEDGARIREIEMRLPFGQLDREKGQTSRPGRSGLTHSETEVCVHDVHVIDDKTHLGDKRHEREIGASRDDNVDNELHRTKSVDRSTSNKVTGRSTGKLNIRRSCSDVTKKGQMMGGFCEKASCFDLRSNSMSAVDYERFILESEVDLLRKRLKTIQQGREQLSFSIERKKEADQLPLSEERSRQLQELKQVTKPEKRFRRASLPPKSSKV